MATVMVSLVIFIVILMVVRCPDHSSFGQIANSAEGDADFSSDNHDTATPPLSMSCLSGAFACWRKVFTSRSFGDGAGGREGERIIGKSAVLHNQCWLFWSLLEASS